MQTATFGVPDPASSFRAGHAPSRPGRAGLTAVVLALGLAAAAAVAARGTPVWTLVREGPADRVGVLLRVAVVWGLGLGAAVPLTFLAHRLLIARRAGAPPLRTTLLRALPVTTFALVALSLLAIAGTGAGSAAGRDGGSAAARAASDRRGRPLIVLGWWDTNVRAGEGNDETGAADGGRNGGFPLSLAVLAVAVTLAGVTVWRAYVSRSADAEAPDAADVAGPDAAAVHAAVRGGIERMLADPDPKTAVIGAYARLLEELAACGAGRREPEAPMEHLRRVLSSLRARPAPLRELTGLFELARFSTHRLDASHRDRALGALRAVAGDLAGASAPGVPARREPGARR